MKKMSLSLSLLFSSTLVCALDLGSLVQDAVKSTTSTPTSSSKTSNLSDSLVTSGLKEALKIGVDYGVKELSKENGYLSNAKIVLPKDMRTAEKLVRKAGGDKIVDDLVKSMNKAATTAAPKTAVIFVDAVNKMTLDDAQKILMGDKDAATEYFSKNTSSSLQKMISPIIKESMKENNVASYYDTFNKYYQSNAASLTKNSQLMGYAKEFGADKYLPSSDADLNSYITEQAISGLFKMIAQKEGEIRKDPIAQTTSILKQVFGN